MKRTSGPVSMPGTRERLLTLSWQGVFLILLTLTACRSISDIKPLRISIINITSDSATLIEGWSPSTRLHYLLTLPTQAATDTPPPLIVFLHSLEERGGPIQLLVDSPEGQGRGIAAYALETENFDFATLSPLCPRGSYWTFLHGRVASLIAKVVAEYGLDPERIFLSGVSMGGMGTWSLGMARPDLFKALAPIAGPVYTPPIRPRYGRLQSVPVFAFHDRHDPSIPFSLAESSIDKFQTQGGNGRLTVYETGRHYIQDLVFEDGELFDWFLGLND